MPERNGPPGRSTGLLVAGVIAVLFGAARDARSDTPGPVLEALCPGCEVLADQEVHLPFTGITYHLLKFHDPAKGAPVARAWLPGGFVADEAALHAAEREARWKTIGAMDPGLAEVVASLNEDALLPVFVWGKADLPEPDDEWLAESDLNAAIIPGDPGATYLDIFSSYCCSTTGIAVWSTDCANPAHQTCISARVLAW